MAGFDVNRVQPADSASTAIVGDLQFVQVKIAVFCDVTSGISSDACKEDYVAPP